MTTRNMQEPEKVKIQGNQTVFIPQRLLTFLELKPEDEVVLQLAIGNHGPFLYLVNQKQQRKWLKETPKEA